MKNNYLAHFRKRLFIIVFVEFLLIAVILPLAIFCYLAYETYYLHSFPDYVIQDRMKDAYTFLFWGIVGISIILLQPTYILYKYYRDLKKIIEELSNTDLQELLLDNEHNSSFFNKYLPSYIFSSDYLYIINVLKKPTKILIADIKSIHKMKAITYPFMAFRIFGYEEVEADMFLASTFLYPSRVIHIQTKNGQKYVLINRSTKMYNYLDNRIKSKQG